MIVSPLMDKSAAVDGRYKIPVIFTLRFRCFFQGALLLEAKSGSCCLSSAEVLPLILKLGNQPSYSPYQHVLRFYVSV